MSDFRYLLLAFVLVFMLSTAGYTLDPPIAYWKLDETEGETAKDEIGILDLFYG